MTTFRKIAFPLVLSVFALGFAACDSDEHGDDEAFLSDYDALMEGAPTNDELPFEIKADGPPPRQHAELLSLQSPVRSQGKRGVCSIFSTVGLMEHLYIAAGDEDPDFSEQYLQWSAKFEVGSFPDTSGSNAYYNLDAINRFGIPEENAWPYEVNQWDEFDDPQCAKANEDKPTRCYTNGAPPPEALQAEKFHLPRGEWRNSSRASIMDHIRVDGTGVVVGLDFFYQSWNHRKSALPRDLDAWDLGVVKYPNAEDVVESHKQRAGHSILIVGWDLDLEFQKVNPDGSGVTDSNGNPVMEKGFWLFKNSWGTSGFGIDNPNGSGYGYLSMQYVDEYGRARVSNIPDIDLPPPGDDDGADDDGGGEAETFSSDELVTIPDNDSAGAVSTIDVASTGDVAKVTVSVDVTHTWRGDLVVTLSHGGTTVTLHDRKGGGEDDLQLALELADFDGTDRGGVWTLELVDTANADTGQLNSWSITIE